MCWMPPHAFVDVVVLLPQELAKIVKDNFVYSRVAKYIGSRSTFTEDQLPVCHCMEAVAASWHVRCLTCVISSRVGLN